MIFLLLGLAKQPTLSPCCKREIKYTGEACGTVGDFIQLTLGREMMENGYGVHFVKYDVT